MSISLVGLPTGARSAADSRWFRAARLLSSLSPASAMSSGSGRSDVSPMRTTSGLQLLVTDENSSEHHFSQAYSLTASPSSLPHTLDRCASSRRPRIRSYRLSIVLRHRATVFCGFLDDDSDSGLPTARFGLCHFQRACFCTSTMLCHHQMRVSRRSFPHTTVCTQASAAVLPTHPNSPMHPSCHPCAPSQRTHARTHAAATLHACCVAITCLFQSNRSLALLWCPS